MLSKKHKAYLKLNIISILFTVISFISATLAWFAYSGLVAVKTEVGVRAWYIEFEKNNEVVSNDIVISLSDIHPGMEPVSELITIKNLGDSDAKLKYNINSARILDDAEDSYEINDTVTSDYIEDALAHNYPFHINIHMSEYYLQPKDGEATFEVSISWPLDSGDDILDSTWGRQAFIFENKEKEHQENDPSYQVEPSIKVVINVQAEQVVDDLTSDDLNYRLGKTVFYDVVSNENCNLVSDTCLKTHVLDTRSLIGDNRVRLLPDLDSNIGNVTYDEYLNKINELKSNWSVDVEYLTASEIIKVISTDIKSSYLKRPNISDLIIGTVNNDSRAIDILDIAKSSNGYFTFDKEEFLFLDASSCVWTVDEYSNKAFALEGGITTGKISAIDKSETCKIIPVIVIDK